LTQVITILNTKIKLIIVNKDEFTREFDSFDPTVRKVIYAIQNAVCWIGPLPKGTLTIFLGSTILIQQLEKLSSLTATMLIGSSEEIEKCMINMLLLFIEETLPSFYLYAYICAGIHFFDQ